MYSLVIKPLADRFFAIAILVIASPFLLIGVAVLYVANGGTVWFRQPRPGLNHKIFTVLKFKTMNDHTDGSGNLLPDAERLTLAGKIIRKASLDELPQLLNVLRGEMSLVGPRPLLVEYLPLYSAEQARRHEVKPGITGWAQVNGRNTVEWEERFKMDVWYVEHVSFMLDLKILLLTVLKVFKADGINSATSATMEKFKGTV